MAIRRDLLGVWLGLALLSGGAAAASPPVITWPGDDKTDLWFIGGQSNALGLCANQPEPFQSDPNILFFCVDRRWRVFQEPLVRYSFPHGDVSGDPTHNSDGGLAQYDGRGASPAFYFARYLRKHLGRTIAFVDADTGGSMAKAWNPDLKSGRPDYYLYDRMIEHLRAAPVAGRLKGAIWYQGESDVIWTPDDVADYCRVLQRFIERFRTDTDNPNLPFLLVQLASFTPGCKPGEPGNAYKGQRYDDLHGTYTRGWDIIQQAQLDFAMKHSNVHLISTVDLTDMADGIHLDQAAQKKLGRRLAEVALTHVYKQSGHGDSLTLDNIVTQNDRITIYFQGVSGRLISRGEPQGFELHYEDDTKSHGIATWPISIELPEDSPAAVQLGGVTGLSFERNPVLYYQPGTKAACTIVDEKGMSLPAFGPLPLRSMK